MSDVTSAFCEYHLRQGILSFLVSFAIVCSTLLVCLFGKKNVEVLAHKCLAHSTHIRR